jgi:hypothetical protein
LNTSGVLRGDGFGGSINDAVSKGDEIFALEGRFKGGHIKYNASEGPNIDLVIVGLMLDEFWSKVERCADSGTLKGGIGCEYFGDSQVAQLNMFIPGKENV